jgi:hypothetical protein
VGLLAACTSVPNVPPPGVKPTTSPSPAAQSPSPPIPTLPPPVAIPATPDDPNAGKVWPFVRTDVLSLVGRMQALDATAGSEYARVRDAYKATGSGSGTLSLTDYTSSEENGRTIWSKQMPLTAPGGLSGQAVMRYAPGGGTDTFVYSESLIAPSGRQVTLRWTRNFLYDYYSTAVSIDDFLAFGPLRHLDWHSSDSFMSRDDSGSGTITVGTTALKVAETGPYGKPNRTMTIRNDAGLTAVATFLRGEPIAGFDVTEGGQSFGRATIPPPSDW